MSLCLKEEQLFASYFMPCSYKRPSLYVTQGASYFFSHIINGICHYHLKEFSFLKSFEPFAFLMQTSHVTSDIDLSYPTLVTVVFSINTSISDAVEV